MQPEVVLDGFFKFSDGIEGASADGLIGDFREESLDEVEPGAGGWNEVENESLVVCEPCLDVGVLVGP